MVNRWLMQYINLNNCLDPRQHAFWLGFDTGTFFNTLGQALQEAMDDNVHVELATLELAKAYNRA